MANAIKFRRPGERPDVTLREVGLAKSRYVRIACQDNGIGIAPAYHQRIFGLFHRLHTQEDFASSGLGLALCKRVVANHWGSIAVASQLGLGSTFDVSPER